MRSRTRNHVASTATSTTDVNQTSGRSEHERPPSRPEQTLEFPAQAPYLSAAFCTRCGIPRRYMRSVSAPSIQMTGPRLWRRLKPTAPYSVMAEVSSMRRASPLTSRCLAVPWAPCTFGVKDDSTLCHVCDPLRKGRHALNRRSSTHRPPQPAARDIVSSGFHL
jgi:hypothetical protein